MASNKKLGPNGFPMLKCDSIEATAKTQIRKKLDKKVIDQYRQDIVDGHIFPAVICFAEKNSDRRVMADGFHRLYAHIHAEKDDIEVDLREGDATDALIHALGANDDHGLRRSKGDKYRAVEIALTHPKVGEMSRQEIADICHVHKRTVQKIANRKAIENPEPGVNGEGAEAEEAKPSDQRPAAKPEPTQEEIERDELRAACKVFMAFPYDGPDATKLDLDADDLANLEYVSTWCAGAVIAGRNQ